MSTKSEILTNEDIYKALCTIQKVCNESEKCWECVLRRDFDECAVNLGMPKDWKINATDTWRAFD